MGSENSSRLSWSSNTAPPSIRQDFNRCSPAQRPVSQIHRRQGERHPLQRTYNTSRTLAMNLHPETPPPDPAVRLQRRSLVKAVRVLTQPPGSIPVLDRRRAHLLAWLLLVVILLTIT